MRKKKTNQQQPPHAMFSGSQVFSWCQAVFSSIFSRQSQLGGLRLRTVSTRIPCRPCPCSGSSMRELDRLPSRGRGWWTSVRNLLEMIGNDRWIHGNTMISRFEGKLWRPPKLDGWAWVFSDQRTAVVGLFPSDSSLSKSEVATSQKDKTHFYHSSGRILLVSFLVGCS